MTIMADSESSVEILDRSAEQNDVIHSGAAPQLDSAPATQAVQDDMDVAESDADADGDDDRRVSDGFQGWTQGQLNDDGPEHDEYDYGEDYHVGENEEDTPREDGEGAGAVGGGRKRGRSTGEKGRPKKKGKPGRRKGESTTREDADDGDALPKPEETMDHPAFCPACQEEHSRDLGTSLHWDTWCTFKEGTKKLWIKSHRQFHLGERFVCPAPTCGSFWHDASFMKRHCKTCPLAAAHQQETAGSQADGAGMPQFDPGTSNRSSQSASAPQPYTVFLFFNPQTKAPSPGWHKSCNKSMPVWLASCDECVQTIGPAEWRLADAEAMESAFEWHYIEHLGMCYACPVAGCTHAASTTAAVARHVSMAHSTVDTASVPRIVYTRCDPATGLPTDGFAGAEVKRKPGAPGAMTADGIKKLFALLRTQAQVDADEYNRSDEERALAKRSPTAPLGVEVTWEECAPQPPAGMVATSSCGPAADDMQGISSAQDRAVTLHVMSAPTLFDYCLDEGWPGSCADCSHDEELLQTMEQAQEEEDSSDAAKAQAKMIHDKVMKHRREHLGELHCCPVRGCTRNELAKVVLANGEGEPSWSLIQWHIKKQHEDIGPARPSPLVVYLKRDPATGQPSAAAARYSAVKPHAASASSLSSAAGSSKGAAQKQHNVAPTAVIAASVPTADAVKKEKSCAPAPPADAALRHESTAVVFTAPARNSESGTKDAGLRIPKRIPDCEVLLPCTGVSALWPVDCFECATAPTVEGPAPHPLPDECFRTDNAGKRAEAAMALDASTRTQCWAHRLLHLGEVIACPVGTQAMAGQGTGTESAAEVACRYAVRPAGPAAQHYEQAVQQVHQHIVTAHPGEYKSSTGERSGLQPVSVYLTWDPRNGQPEASLQEQYANSVQLAAHGKGAQGVKTAFPEAARTDLCAFIRYLSRADVDSVPPSILDGSDPTLPSFVTFRPRELLGWPNTCSDSTCKAIASRLNSSSLPLSALEAQLLVHRGLHRGETWACPHEACPFVQQTTGREDGCKTMQAHVVRAHPGLKYKLGQLLAHVRYGRKASSAAGGAGSGGTQAYQGGHGSGASASASSSTAGGGSWVEAPFSALSSRAVVQRVLGRVSAHTGGLGMPLGMTASGHGSSSLLGAGSKGTASAPAPSGAGIAPVPCQADHSYEGGIDQL